MGSLTEELEGELGPEPGAGAAGRSGTAVGAGLFTRANSVDTVAVLDWLGVPHESTPRGMMAQCPGCGEEGALVGRDGGLKCLHDRCAHAGTPDHRGFRTNAALVALVRSTDDATAAKEICRRFGLEREFKRPEPEPKWDSVPPEAYDFEPEESTPDNVVPIDQAARSKVPASRRLGLMSIQELIGIVHRELQKTEREAGVPTGNSEIDAALGGFRRGNVTVLGAKRGFGKTTFSIHAADVAIGRGFRVVLLAGEDSAMMYGKRWAARRAQLNAMRVRDLEVDSDDDKAKVARAFADAPSLPFFLRTAGQPVEWICQALRDLRKEGEIHLVIADYLQCIRAGKGQQDRRNEVTYVMGELVTVIREINAAGLLLSQLKRTDRVRPEIEDLKESGDIEDKADHVLLGFKEEQPGGLPAKRKVLVAKNKDGTDDFDDIELPFDAFTASFLEHRPAWQSGDDYDRRYP